MTDKTDKVNENTVRENATQEHTAQEKATQEETSLEALFETLETVVTRMEREDISLEEAFRLYHQGMTLLKSCNDTIDTVEKKVLMLDEDGKIHEF